jgi:hypothetical protein
MISLLYSSTRLLAKPEGLNGLNGGLVGIDGFFFVEAALQPLSSMSTKPSRLACDELSRVESRSHQSANEGGRSHSEFYQRAIVKESIKAPATPGPGYDDFLR